MQQLVQQYGLVAALIYLTTSFIVGVPIAYGLSKGIDGSGWSFWGAVIGGTFASLKLSQIPRLALTAALTPVVVRYLPEAVLLALTPEQEPAPAPAASARLELLELRDVPLDDALRLIAAESDLNVVASRAAARTRVTLLLRDVEPVAALSTLCSSHDLWFERDAATAVYRIRTASEYQRGVQNLASAKLEVFTLLYPNALDVAYSIRDLFGQRVRA